MFISRKAINFINRIHEKSTRIVNGDNKSNFENLLEKNIENNSLKKLASNND